MQAAPGRRAIESLGLQEAAHRAIDHARARHAEAGLFEHLQRKAFRTKEIGPAIAEGRSTRRRELHEDVTVIAEPGQELGLFAACRRARRQPRRHVAGEILIRGLEPVDRESMSGRCLRVVAQQDGARRIVHALRGKKRVLQRPSLGVGVKPEVGQPLGQQAAEKAMRSHGREEPGQAASDKEVDALCFHMQLRAGQEAQGSPSLDAAALIRPPKRLLSGHAANGLRQGIAGPLASPQDEDLRRELTQQPRDRRLALA